ncbi:cytoskeleton protein RodZ [Candidatus Erwinia haradaeae]|uniref:Cytoskeleton protein RodZ, partial n=1 Tax=Candidatus Erwinia haradaeae TaxID=1922217 RepID=A0A451D2Z4_9GAMM|nr:cytoskeleton protein RodZ [Candidatus Erwinia haradaeae]VFP80024.1 Cytoskeleton protein RodZ [Candidatus Erwinia haradaeae]
MNIEDTRDISNINSIGGRLRSARENLGLTQKNIADRLCLKISIIRDIEEDNLPTSLASTFLRGYIRSYARLVQVPEDELQSMMTKQTLMKDTQVAIMKSYSLGKNRNKKDNILMICTWFILLLLISVTVIWWWQNSTNDQNNLELINNQHTQVKIDTH